MSRHRHELAYRAKNVHKIYEGLCEYKEICFQGQNRYIAKLGTLTKLCFSPKVYLIFRKRTR